MQSCVRLIWRTQVSLQRYKTFLLDFFCMIHISSAILTLLGGMLEVAIANHP